jgi:phenylalanyl-tRNA synthetase beta chain
MLASHAWLKAFVPHGRTVDETRALLSAHVATVDAVESMRADLAPIVVARVLAVAPHPDSDHLWLTKVDDGTGAPLEVVCGAPNVAPNTLYPFARTGTVMPGGLKIEKRKIRGVVSNGMLCSARELGLGADQSGILALSVDCAPGTPFLDALPVGDARFEIDVLPNRPDLLCHVGLARELSALTGVPLQTPTELAALSLPAAPATAEREGNTGGVTVRIEDAEGCPRYLAIVIRGIQVGPSPDWLRDRLASLGLRSISNIVDVTNYFLHAYGQPMHAFDVTKLGGSSVVIRRARAGEKLTTLDGVARTLDVEMVVIADGERATAVAGVIGGRDSEVTDATTDVLLEVANFEPRRVRRTRRALGITTDASHRFERGTDPAELERAGALAAALIASLGGGRVEGTGLLVGQPAALRQPVSVNPARLSRLLGAPVSAADVKKHLAAIGFTVRGDGDALSVTAPSWRHDVSRDVDILEEVARLRGFDALPDELTAFRPSAVPDHPLNGVAQRVRDALVGAGFAEVRPLPFVAGDDATHVRVTNPLADDEPHLRRSLLESLVQRAEHNLKRREGDLRLFEVGSAFVPTTDGVREECRVGVLLMGARRPVHFTEAEPPRLDAWDARATAETMVRAAENRAPALDAATDGALWHVSVAGRRLGEVRRLTLDSPPWAAPAFGVEITLGDLALTPVAAPGTHAHGQPVDVGRHLPPVKYRPLPVTPAAEFDLAVIVPDATSAARVEDAMRRAAGELVERVSLFDEFRGPGVPDGHRSLAWRLTFRHPERTLNEKEIAGRRQKIIATLERELGVITRTG